MVPILKQGTSALIISNDEKEPVQQHMKRQQIHDIRLQESSVTVPVT